MELLYNYDQNLPSKMRNLPNRLCQEIYLPVFMEPYYSDFGVYESQGKLISLDIQPDENGDYTHTVTDVQGLVPSYGDESPQVTSKGFVNFSRVLELVDPESRSQYVTQVTEAALIMLVKETYNKEPARLSKNDIPESEYMLEITCRYILEMGHPSAKALKALRIIHSLATKSERGWYPPIFFILTAIKLLKVGTSKHIRFYH